MTVALSSLRISSDFDSSRYVAGMQAKVDADRKGAASSEAVGAAVDNSKIKVSSAVPLIERLSRTYVDGYGTAAKFNSEVMKLARSQETAAVSADHLEAIYSGLQGRFGLTADSTELAARGYTQLASAIETVNARLNTQRMEANRTAEAMQHVALANDNRPGAGVSAGAHRAAGLNAGYQLQDIAVTAAGGMSPTMIALQQGTQLADALTMNGGGVKGVAATAAAAFGSLLNPINLATIATVGLGAAAIQYFTRSSAEAEKQKSELQTQADLIRKVAKEWGDATPMLKAYADQLDRTQGLQDRVNASNGAAKQSLDQIAPLLTDIPKAFSAASRSLAGTSDQQSFAKQFRKEFEDISEGAKNGSVAISDVADVQHLLADEIARRSTPQLLALKSLFDSVATSIKSAIEQSKEFAAQPYLTGANVQDIVSGSTFRNSDGSIGQAQSGTIFRNQDMIPKNPPVPESRPNIELEGSDDDRINAQIENNRRMQAAEIAHMGARSPRELEAAARAREEANIIPTETDPERSSRIDLAGTKARLQAEFQLKQAQQDRIRSLDQSVQQQQQELTLIGKTGGAAEALRMQFTLINQVRDEAARNHLPADEKEIELIKAKTAEYGRLADQMNSTKLHADLADQQRLGLLSPTDQQVSSTLKQYGLPQDLSSGDAQSIRSTLQAAQIKEGVKGFFTDFRSELESNGGKAGKAFGDALKNSLMNALNKAADDSMDRLLNILLSPLTGGKAQSSIGAAVTAPLTGGLAAKAVNPIAAGDMSVFGSAIKSIESGGNYGALGPITRTGDRAYGAYQIMGANIGPWSKDALGRSISKDEFLQNPSLQDQIFNHRFGGYVNQFGANGAAEAWLGGPGAVGKSGLTDQLGTSVGAYAQKFNSAVSAMTNSAGTASKGLGTLGSSLSSFFPAAPTRSAGQGGGIFGWLGSLFSKPFSPIGGQATLAASGSIFGLFDGGGYTGHGGVHQPAGIVHRGEVVWSQSDIARAGGVSVVEGMRQGMRGYADGGIVSGDRAAVRPTVRMPDNGGSVGRPSAPVRVESAIKVSFDQDDGFRAYVDESAKKHGRQQAMQTTAEYNDGMGRGNLGTIQNAFTARKN